MRPLLVLAALLALPVVLAANIDDCKEAGSLSREALVSNVTSHEVRFHIFLPPCYASRADTYPLLTLLHGSDADDQQWARLGFIHALEVAMQSENAPPMIVLMPYGGAAANDNSFGPDSYDKVLLGFLTQIEARYRANGIRAIGGISRGGFWAYHLGLRFPEQFVAIGGHSPFFDEDHVLPAYNPLALVESLHPDSRLKLWLDRGTRDYAAQGVDNMHVKLQALQMPHQYVVYPDSDHSEAAWSRHVSDYVAFYSNAFSPPADTNATKTPEQQDEYELWLPAAGFGALLLSIDSCRLGRAACGNAR